MFEYRFKLFFNNILGFVAVILNIILTISILISFNKTTNTKEILKPEFQSIINSSNVNGSILIYDAQKDCSTQITLIGLK